MKPSFKKLQVAIIGVGAMGSNHVRVFSQMENIDLVAIADKDPQLLENTAKRYDLRYYTDYKEMFDKETIDAVTIAVPTRLHYQIGKEVIAKKIDLLIEKPLATTVTECRKLIKLAQKNKVLLGVGHVERFNPVVTALKKYLNEDKLGRVFQIVIRRMGPFPQRIRDVGVFLDLATHDIDLIRFLTGAEVKRLSAESARLIHSKHEDLALSLLRLTNGVIGVLIENWLSPTKIRDIYVNGEKGLMVANFITQDLYFYENNYTPSDWNSMQVFRGMTEGNMMRYYISRDEPLRLELEAFIHAVNHQQPFFVSGEDGLVSVQLAQRLLKVASK